MKRDIEVLKRRMLTVPVDIFGAINDYSIELERKPLESGVSGKISYDDGQFKIAVESRDAPVRQRFTAAHELAHFLLHSRLISEAGELNRHEDILFELNGATNPTAPLSRAHEVEANKLAATILMPAGYIRDHYDKERDNVAELASDLQVSKAAVEIRLKNLGLKQ